jgi:amidase
MHVESRRIISHWFSDFDILLTPTLPTKVPEVNLILSEANDLLNGRSEQEARMLAFNSAANIADLPAISLPMATDNDGLPIGVQLIGGSFEEGTLLRLGAALEMQAAWTKRTPERYC